jgi:hypothetical protein
VVMITTAATNQVAIGSLELLHLSRGNLIDMGGPILLDSMLSPFALLMAGSAQFG